MGQQAGNLVIFIKTGECDAINIRECPGESIGQAINQLIKVLGANKADLNKTKARPDAGIMFNTIFKVRKLSP
jgi:hypothetical protein